MFPEGFLTVERIQLDCESHSKKRVLQRIGEILATVSEDLDGDDIFDKLFERERIGATGLGHGIGLPHARIENISEARATLFIMSEAVDYDAADQQLVDLLFGLVVPENMESAERNHLDILANLAAMFSDEEMRKKFRSSNDPQQILNYFNAWCNSHSSPKE